MASHSSLLDACEKGNAVLARALLEEMSAEEVNYACPQRGTPLHCASGLGHVDCVRAILQAGGDPNMIDKGLSPLFLAAHLKTSVVAGLLLDHGADANLVGIDPAVTEEEYQTIHPLYVAVLSCSEPNVSKLLQKGASPNMGLYGPRQVTCLHAAVENGDARIVKALLEAGASVDATDGQGRTALFSACAGLGDEDDEGDVEILEGIVSMLLSFKADPNFKVSMEDGSWVTCIHMAVSTGHLGVVRCLVNGGAQVNVIDCDGATPLYHAACEGLPELSELLLKSGADPNAQDIDGRSPLLISICGVDQDEDGDENTSDKKRKKSAEDPTEDGRKKVAEILVRSGANLDLADSEGLTAREAATGLGGEWPELLLGAINNSDSKGKSPIRAQNEGHQAKKSKQDATEGSV